MKITKSQLKQIIKEELEEAFDIGDVLRATKSDEERLDILDKYSQAADERGSAVLKDTWGKMDDASARRRYNDYVLSQGEYEDGGLFDPTYESLYDDFIEWMRLHPKEFGNELSSLDRGENPMAAYAAKMSARRRK
jgi:hypothetical protein